MKKFLINCILFSIPIVLIIFIIFCLADGHTDEYYLRFTSPQQKSLIIGTSSASQGLQPEVFNKILFKEDNSNKFYNYSFTRGTSNYGPAYLKSIKKKLDPKTRNAIFILTVDPMGLCSIDKKDSISFVESDRFVGKTHFVNQSPNIQYLIFSYSHPYFNLIKNKFTPPPFLLHKDGWLELNVPMEKDLVNNRMETKYKQYLATIKTFKFSTKRYEYLELTINYLKKHGKVYLVRLPIHPRMQEIENKVMSDFNEKMLVLSQTTNTPYLNLMTNKDNYTYIDGSHLYRTSAAVVSAEVANWILKVK